MQVAFAERVAVILLACFPERVQEAKRHPDSFIGVVICISNSAASNKGASAHQRKLHSSCSFERLSLTWVSLVVTAIVMAILGRAVSRVSREQARSAKFASLGCAVLYRIFVRL